MQIGSVQGTYSYYSGSNNLKKTAKNSEEDVSSLKNNAKAVNDQNLSEEESKKVNELKKRDQEVKQHEQAHKNAGGALAGMPQYEYKTGPDGKQYATGGHVSIDTSKGRSPEETIQKAQKIRRAALAPQNPSQADRKVAQEASRMENEARAEIAQKKAEGLKAYGMDTNAVSAKEEDSSDSKSLNNEESIKEISDNKKERNPGQIGYSGGPKRLDSDLGEVSVPLFNQLA